MAHWARWENAGNVSMYEKHFALMRRPFVTTADTVSYYPSTAHERALKQLLDGVHRQVPFAVVVGEPGTGKTLLAHRLLERVQGQVVAIWLTNTHLPGAAALFQALLYDLGQPFQGKTEQELRIAFTDHLLEIYSKKQQTLVAIDEAQHLTPELLEELRLLSNLETRHGKALLIALFGLPTMIETLRRPELTALWQRIGVRAQLGGMDVHEAVDYLLHHVRAAGGRAERIITEEALEVLARATEGVPRLLNQAADRAFQIAFEAQQHAVDAEAALEALGEMGLAADLEAA